MLFTAKHIKMCKEAKEIQKDWKPKVGDYCVCSRGMIGVLTSDKKQKVTYPDGNTGYAYIGVRLKDGAPWSSRNPIWLPTQEQLQEMWEKEYLKRPTKKGWFGEFVDWMGDRYNKREEIPEEIFDTMTELWLAFIMWKKYGKVWDDEKEEWLKGDSYD